MKILITGGAGFIGSHLLDELVKKGNEVWIIDDLSTGRMENIAHHEKNPKVHIIIDTIMNEKLMTRVISKVDQIYHLAAAVGVKYIIDNPLKSMEINIKGTEAVLALANKKKKKVLVASTSEIYGKNNNKLFREDDDRIMGSTKIIRWSYANAKALDEFFAFAYYREKQLPVVIVRLFNTCGPRQLGEYGMVIPRLIKQALLNHPITVHGDGMQTRSFTYITDVIYALIRLMETEKAVGDVFNIGNPKGITINELAKKIQKATKSKSKIVKIPYEKAFEKGFEDMRYRVPDISKLQSVINYKPKVDIDEMLKKITEYFKS